MNKKFKNLFLAGAIVLGLAGVAVSCTDYDGDINDLTERVKKLESTVSDLQTAINNGAVITDVTPITNGVKVTLSNGKSFDVTNGKDGQNGKDGVNGKDGSVVTIGANGNWFIDGKDTGFASKGDKGDPGKDGVNGKDGQNGKDGVNGKDGADGKDGAPGKDGVDGKDALQVWYQPCTDKNDANYGKWIKYTYDPATKQTTSEVTNIEVFPEGTVTAVYDKESGKLTFHGVEGAEKGVLEIALAANLKSIALIPEALMEGLGYIEFPYVVYVQDGNDWIFHSSAATDVTYRLNPENANVDANEWAFINRKVKTIHMGTRSVSDNNDLVSIVGGKPTKVAGGEATFSIKLNDDPEWPNQVWFGAIETDANDAEDDGKNDIIALQTTVNGETITSDYAYVYAVGAYGYYALIHKDFTKEDVSPIKNTIRAYRTEPITIDEKADDVLYPELMTPELLYTDVDGLDLKNYVTLAADGSSNVDIALAEDLGIDVNYKFELVNDKGQVNKPFLGTDNRTDQNQFVVLDGSVVKINKDFLNESTRPAVNRTPQVKVTATTKIGDKDYTLATCYIMIRIVEEKVAPEEPVVYFKTYTDHFVKFCGDEVIKFTKPQTVCPDYTDDKLEVTWEEVNKNVLGGLGLSYEAFLDEYDTDNLYVLDIKKGADGQLDTTYVPVEQYTFPAGITYFAEAPEEWATSTNVISLYVDKDVKIPSNGTVEFAYKAKKNSKKTPNVGFKFAYEITPKTPTKHEHDFVTPVKLILNPDYLLGEMNVPVEAKPVSKYIPSTENYNVYAGVRVKGKAGADKNFTYSSSLIEHFEEYGKNIKIADDATISFEIMHSTSDWKVNYADDAFKFITADGDAVDKVDFTAEEFNSIIKQHGTSPDIKFMKPLLTEDINVLVKVTEKCTSDADVITPAKEKVGYYYVVFQTPFEVLTNKDKDIVLGTFRMEKDTTYIPTDIKIVEKSNNKNVIFNFNFAEGKMIATPYAKSQYGLNDLDGSISFNSKPLTYPYADTEDSFGQNLTYGSDTDGFFVAWVNLGTDLLTDKLAQYNLVVTVGDLYRLNLNGKVTVLSTANTKAKWPNGRADKIK